MQNHFLCCQIERHLGTHGQRSQKEYRRSRHRKNRKGVDMAVPRLKIATLQRFPSARLNMTLGVPCIVAFFFFCGVPLCAICFAGEGKDTTPLLKTAHRAKNGQKSRASRPDDEEGRRCLTAGGFAYILGTNQNALFGAKTVILLVIHVGSRKSRRKERGHGCAPFPKTSDGNADRGTICGIFSKNGWTFDTIQNSPLGGTLLDALWIWVVTIADFP